MAKPGLRGSPREGKNSSGMIGDKTRRRFFSRRPTLRREVTNNSNTVPNLLKILPGLYKENVGRRVVVHAGGEGQANHCVAVRQVGSCWLRAVPIAGGGSFLPHPGMLCLLGLLPELNADLERRMESARKYRRRSKERQLKALLGPLSISQSLCIFTF